MPIYSVEEVLSGTFPTATSIVSLVPSLSITVADLGAAHLLTGITKFCIHPRQLRQEKTVIGGTKDVKTELVASLKPAWILASKEENVREQVEVLAGDSNVLLTDVTDLSEALTANEAIGILCGRRKEAAAMNRQISQRFEALINISGPKKVAYFIWRKPWMVAGGDTFISRMLEAGGWENVFREEMRYPTIDVSDLPTALDYIFLSSEPYPFQQKHIDEISSLLPVGHRVKIVLVDGELFSWYGSKLLESPAYFAALNTQLNA